MAIPSAALTRRVTWSGRPTNRSGIDLSDATFAALDGFGHIMRGYGVEDVRAVATSAVREANNAELFLDRVKNHTGIEFEIINESEESRLVNLAARLPYLFARSFGARTTRQVAHSLGEELGL